MNKYIIQCFKCKFNNLCFYIYLSQVADLSMGDLLLHSTVVWINPPASLCKSKKDPELAAFGKDYYGFWIILWNQFFPTVVFISIEIS